ncbi:MAG: hypothetical protein ABR517_10335 [Thermoanaerobaculia bacterium]
MRFVVALLLVLVAMNVAILVYARTVNRTAEIAVRTALGATRRRIVTQLFDVDVLAGRSFGAADTPAPDQPPGSVIVNRSFVTELMSGGSAVGRRVRFASAGDESQPWFEIAGLVDDFPGRFRAAPRSRG